MAGQRDDARNVLDELHRMAKDTYVAPYNEAVVHAGLGDGDAAFAALECAFDECSYLLMEYLNTDERSKSLRADSRFESLRWRSRLLKVD